MKTRKILAFLLCIALIMSVSVSVYAEGEDLLFKDKPVSEQYEQLIALDGDNEAQEALLATLTEEQLSALSEYAQSVQPAREMPKTVTFVDAGPFMPAVQVQTALRRAAAKAAANEEENGLILSKTAVPDGSGGYKIRMEAYTTGKVTTSATTVPVDIVLVLDQSGSMAYDFSGNSTNTNEARRQYAMKQAVNNFINEVAGKYSAEADHRMAIVQFNSGASVLQGWTAVDTEGCNALKDKINGLLDSPSGATNVAAGMNQAETLMGSEYNYTGANTNRQKVVIVFTDGVPTTASDFDTKVANSAIASAKKLKDGGATVYSIGIFNGANPNELYGASGFDTNSDGTVGSQWILDTWGLLPGNDFPEADRPATNRFLNYISSNYKDTANVGLTRETSGLGILHYKITYKITQNFDRSASNYYLTAADATSLNKIFKTISENIETQDIDLGSETVIKDIVSPYFTAPAGASDVKLYTADYNGSDFGSDVSAPDTVKPQFSGDTVSVTGFDFNKNFVSQNIKEDGTYGKKLIIEFNVNAKADFLGGDSVPTNGDASGVYDKDGNLVEAFVVPEVKVPVKTLIPEGIDKNIYLMGSVSAEDVFSKGKLNGSAFDPNGENNKFVDIVYTVKDGETVLGTYTIARGTTEGAWAGGAIPTLSPAGDKTYTITCTVKASETNKAEAKASANINVFKPELTFKDAAVYYGDNAPQFDAVNKVSEVWKHGETLSTAVVMTGDKPVLALSYLPEAGAIADGKIAVKTDIPVRVSVKIGAADITAQTSFAHENCTESSCAFDPTDGQFLLHVKTCSLTIEKTGGAEDESYLFTVTGPDGTYRIAVQGNSARTIVGLPVGEYTVKEDDGWSWRFEATDIIQQLSPESSSGTVTVSNVQSIFKWLSGDSFKINLFGQEPKS